MPQDHHHGFSPFGGGSRDEMPGFHLGDDNVPPSVKAAREEEARKRKEKEAILREIDQERLRQWEQAKREKIEAERKKKEASERLALIEPGRTDVRVKEPECASPPCATGSLPSPAAAPPPARANAVEILGSPDASSQTESPNQNNPSPAGRTGNGKQPPLPVAHNIAPQPSVNVATPKSAQEDWDDENYATPPQRETFSGTGESPPPLHALGAGASPPLSPTDDWDDEKYATPPQNSYGVKVRPGSPLEGLKRRPPPPQHAPHPGAGAEPKNETPLWQRTTGLTPQQEPKMDRNQRRQALKKLRSEYESRIHESLREYDREQREAAEKIGDRSVSAARKLSMHEIEQLPASDRTFLWSPLDAICHELSIARRKLSAYMRELTGMSAQEVVDKIKAEYLAVRLKEMLAAQAKLDYEVRLATAQPQKKEWSILAAAGDLLKREWEKRRAEPGIAWAENYRYAARQQFARELGFSSYNRLYRACLLAFGKTVMELEHAAAVELFAELDKEMAERPEILQAG